MIFRGFRVLGFWGFGGLGFRAFFGGLEVNACWLEVQSFGDVRFRALDLALATLACLDLRCRAC